MPPSTAVDRILALARRLADSLGELTLNEVDGECYWRGCHARLLARVEADPAAQAAIYDERYPGLIYLPTAQPWDALPPLEQEVRRTLPSRVLMALKYGYPIRLRASACDWQFRSFDVTQPELVLRVPVAVGTGEDAELKVAQALVEMARLTQHPAASRDPSRARLDLRLGLDPAEAGSEAVELEVTLGGPYVEAIIPLPAPAPGFIGKAIDAFLDVLERSDLTAPKLKLRQEPHVALRTWITALLMAEGLRFAKAHPLACEAIGSEPVSQKEDGEQRRRLLQRVPEAEPCFGARRGPKAQHIPTTVAR